MQDQRARSLVPLFRNTKQLATQAQAGIPVLLKQNGLGADKFRNGMRFSKKLGEKIQD